MARGNKYTCASCGKGYEYCPSCALTKPSYDAERFCSRSHAEIFSILSKHGCHLATAEETLEALNSYDTNGLTESIEKHIESLLTEEEPKEVESDEGFAQE